MLKFSMACIFLGYRLLVILMVLFLLIYRVVALIYGIPNSSRIVRMERIALTALVLAANSASVELMATVGC